MRLAKFPLLKILDQFDFTCVPSLNKAKVLSLAQGDYLDRHDNLILMGNSGTWGLWPASRGKDYGTSLSEGLKVRYAIPSMD